MATGASSVAQGNFADLVFGFYFVNFFCTAPLGAPAGEAEQHAHSMHRGLSPTRKRPPMELFFYIGHPRARMRLDHP